MNVGNLILLVEDNESDEILARRALRELQFPYQLEVVVDGVQALEYLSDSSQPQPQLVLLDLNLPRMKGIEVLRAIRNDPEKDRLPVVIFTSSDDEVEAGKCLSLGANSYVRKSVDFAEHLRRIKFMAEYWLTINDPCIGAYRKTA